MEEGSEVHMETSVSSSTGDGQDAAEAAAAPGSSHRGVETVILVESVDEEDMSPNKKAPETTETTSPDKTDPPKTPPKPLQQDMTVKKIIIKSPFKDFQVRTVQRRPSKPEEPKKSGTPEIQCSGSAQSSISQKTENASDSSSKQENKASPSKKEMTIQNAVNSSSSEKPYEKSPTKDSSPNKQQGSPRVQPIKIILPKDAPAKIATIKSPTEKTFIHKDQQKESPTKSDTVKGPPVNPPIKISISKETGVKTIPVKEVALIPPAEPSPVTTREKQTLNKEKQTVTKEKQTPTREVQITLRERQTPGREKQTPGKEVQAKEVELQTTCTPIKTLPVDEQTNKSTTAKELPSKTSEPTPTKTENKPEEPIINKNISLIDDVDASNDSHIETNSDTSEKEHNKSISRELRSLINSAKESKIISECTQLTSKTRKSRSALDSANTSVSSPADSEKIQGVRRYSDNSQRSTSSDKSDKPTIKRSMRSQNPEFVSKVKNFLNSVSGKPKDGEGSDEEAKDKPKEIESESTPSVPKKKKTDEAIKDSVAEKKTPDKGMSENSFRTDPYCWRCHWSIQPLENEKVLPSINCSVCPRSFHAKCLSGVERNKMHMEKSWVCPECLLILQAESSDSRSPAMKKISLGMLCDLLKYALERMMEVNGVEPFTHPVDRNLFPDYNKYVVHPMDLSLMKKYIDDGHYGSTEAFLADAQWILHNSIIFNTLQAKLTGGARALVRSCRAEMGEIEACPECYAAAHARRPTWFTDVCTTPHILLWAKLKGFPYWPAKGMSINHQGLVDVRFFGAHDRAWVPARDCFLYSEKDPNNFRTKRQDILDSMQEAEQHIRNISRKYGKFVYPPFKTQFDPSKLYEQIKLMIPSFEGEVRAPVKEKNSTSSPGMPVSMKDNRRSHSKSSKASTNDGDTSEGEETATSRKMPDGGEIAREEEDFSVEKDKEKNKAMEVDTPKIKENETPTLRKRRRSELEEAVITIIDNSKEKRRRLDRTASADKRDPKPTESKDQNENKSQEKTKNKDTPAKGKEADPNVNEAEPSTSTGDKKASPKITPIRVISIAKVMKNGKPSPKVSLIKQKEDDKTVKPEEEKGGTPKEKEDDKASKKDEDKQQKSKDETPSKKAKQDKSVPEKDKATPQEDKKAKRRNSNKNKSLNNSNAKTDKKNDKPTETKENANKTNEPKPKSSNKDSDHIDDDTSLAVLARVVKNNSTPGLPTITSVRSLSSNQGAKSIEVTVEATSSSSIFTPTSTENVRNMKEAINKLQKLRGDNEKKTSNEKQPAKEKQTSKEKSLPGKPVQEKPPQEKPPQVGRVGVRAFARMTSPSDKEARPNDVQVEVKSEPMEYEETERQMQEKIEMMNAFKLRPVNPPASNLREVRINKVVVTPMARKGTSTVQVQTPPQAQPTRAKKTFPQPKKPDEGRSELTCKNSMVYIPIQPPMTQAPIRGPRPVGTTLPSTPPQPRAITPMNTTSNAINSAVNTNTAPLVTFSSPSTSATSSASNTPIQSIPTVGQVPSTVHTMPLITSVNGQWTFSLQPVLSVGGDNTPSSPMVNGIAERPPLVPLGGAGPVLVGPGLPATPPALPLPPPAPAPTTTTPAPSQRTATENPSPGEPPRLQQRPSLVNPFDANAPMGSIPPPSSVGPLTAKLNQNAVKMTDFFRTLLEDSIEKIEEPSAQLTALKLQVEQAQWRHQQAIDELKHNHELVLVEMRSSFEKEKQRLVTETRRQSQLELDAAVKSAKSKQWCANCNQEAQFYCCWNTSYCDYGCQRAHWATHYAVCTQPRADNNGGNAESNAPERLQAAPENLPKTTAAPNMTISKLQPGRVYTQEQAQGQKPSIIVSMVEDASGNQTMKCVGTFKPPGSGTPATMSPLILNKQLLNSDEAKKVVTSGGYLIVGASNSAPNSSTITQARRTHAIQYIS